MNLCTLNVSKQLWKIWSEWFLDESKEFGKVGCQCLVKHRSISRRQYFTLQSEWADSVCCQVWEPIRETNSRSNHQGTLDQSSQLAETLWTNPKEWNWYARADVHLEKKKLKKTKTPHKIKHRPGTIWWTFPLNPRMQGKKPHSTHCLYSLTVQGGN